MHHFLSMIVVPYQAQYAIAFSDRYRSAATEPDKAVNPEVEQPSPFVTVSRTICLVNAHRCKALILRFSTRFKVDHKWLSWLTNIRGSSEDIFLGVQEIRRTRKGKIRLRETKTQDGAPVASAMV